MDLLRVGRSLRALRIRRGLRQEDVGLAAGLSRMKVARLERGESARLPIGDVDAIVRALGADLDVRVRWHGENLDRLLDAAHAALVEAVVRRLRRSGWEVAVEVSFNIDGERGSVDVLGFHPGRRALIVVEAKSTVADAQSTISVHDRKVRLGWRIARTRGWVPATIGRLLAVGSDATARRRIQEHEAAFGAAYPDRGSVARRWLADPAGAFAGLIFVAYGHGVTIRRSRPWRQRVRRRQWSRGER